MPPSKDESEEFLDRVEKMLAKELLKLLQTLLV